MPVLVLPAAPPRDLAFATLDLLAWSIARDVERKLTASTPVEGADHVAA